MGYTNISHLIFIWNQTTRVH